MLKFIRSILPWCALLIFSFSCQHEEYLSPAKGNATFSLAQKTRDNGRGMETATPAFVLLSLKDSKEEKQENIKLSLFAFGQGYLSENLELQTGNYQLTQFVVLDSANKVIYATPLEGSALAKYVTDPLPMVFTVTQNENIQVTPQVLPVSPTDVPGDFGYASFGFDVVFKGSVLIKTAVTLEIGGVVYENLDAHITVKGYDSLNAAQWTKDYSFVGPTDTLEVQRGFHHYSIELVDKWGINDIQSEIPGNEIWDGRADGPLPVTYNLGGSKQAKKLTMYVNYMEVNVLDVGHVFVPESKVLYTYNGDGRLEYIHHQYYNNETSQFEESTVDAFTYSGSVVSKIITSMNGRPITEYQYEYGLENKITATNVIDRAWTIQRMTHPSYDDPANNHVNVNYSFSNGNSFLYEFDFLFKNLVSDKTTKAGQLCNQGNYTYDKYINPFRHLGYMDFNLQNWSASNRLTEDVDYKACAFPANIPLSYHYTYDKDGYPVKKITTYKSGIPNAPAYHSELNFYYK